MADKLYMRVRGRVLGPYDSDKLQSLVKRGQLGRLHEVSEDGVTWVRATNFPELFVTPAGAAGMAAAVMSPANRPSSSSGSEPTQEYAVGGTEADGKAPKLKTWYYTSGSGQIGPVDFRFLQKLAAGGQIGPADLVWSEGMAEWTAPSLVPGLGAPAPAGGSPKVTVGSGPDSGEVPAGVCRSLARSRYWILFLSIMTFIYAGISAAFGVWLFVFGFSAEITSIVGRSLVLLTSAIVGALGGFLLLAYANRIGVLQYRRNFQQLEATVEAARRYWLYLGLLQIAFLIVMAVFSVWVMAVGGATVRDNVRSFF